MSGRVRLILVLGAANAMGPLSIDMYLPALPELTRDLETSASQVQFTLTACVMGLALGQLVVGPLSDRYGRRVPMVAALGTYAVVSVLCALAASVGQLTVLRFLQGLAGAGGIVIARAIVRDLHSGAAAVKLFSALMLVTGLAPILAPLVGGQVLAVSSWRGIFVVLSVAGAAIGAGAALMLSETLPPERRSTKGVRHTLATMRALLRDRAFVGHGLAGGLAFGALFAYISGSSFVLQDVYGVSPQVYSLLFGINGIGLIAGSQVNARVVERFGPSLLLRRGLAAIFAAAVALLVVVATDAVGIVGVLVPMFCVISMISFVLPNATALALAEHGAVAGTASALLGVMQFSVGALIAPLTGVAGTDTAVPMAVVMVAAAACGLLAAGMARRRQPSLS
jgi:DHA1 family bicyclomycin/chloramphenicol resistance-like MFS transporter